MHGVATRRMTYMGYGGRAGLRAGPAGRGDRAHDREEGAVEHLEEILDVPGIDMIQWGPRTTMSTGHAGGARAPGGAGGGEEGVRRPAWRGASRPGRKIGSPEDAKRFLDMGCATSAWGRTSPCSTSPCAGTGRDARPLEVTGLLGPSLAGPFLAAGRWGSPAGRWGPSQPRRGGRPAGLVGGTVLAREGLPRPGPWWPSSSPAPSGATRPGPGPGGVSWRGQGGPPGRLAGAGQRRRGGGPGPGRPAGRPAFLGALATAGRAPGPPRLGLLASVAPAW